MKMNSWNPFFLAICISLLLVMFNELGFFFFYVFFISSMHGRVDRVKEGCVNALKSFRLRTRRSATKKREKDWKNELICENARPVGWKLSEHMTRNCSHVVFRVAGKLHAWNIKDEWRANDVFRPEPSAIWNDVRMFFSWTLVSCAGP